jgi:hypothetical protein
VTRGLWRRVQCRDAGLTVRCDPLHQCGSTMAVIRLFSLPWVVEAMHAITVRGDVVVVPGRKMSTRLNPVPGQCDVPELTAFCGCGVMQPRDVVTRGADVYQQVPLSVRLCTVLLRVLHAEVTQDDEEV